MAKASHGDNRHFEHLPQTSFGLPTPAVNDKGRYRQRAGSGASSHPQFSTDGGSNSENNALASKSQILRTAFRDH